MTTLLERLQSYLPQPDIHTQPLVKSGLYHTLWEGDGNITRLHLRVEQDGSGLLIANASAAARLSPVGAFIAKSLVVGKEDFHIKQALKERYNTTTPQIERDIEEVRHLLEKLKTPSDDYPVFNLADAAFSPYQAQLMAPLEANIPLAPPQQLLPLLEKAWDVGIPHVTVLVPTMPNPEHLVLAVERAEDLGLICGVSGRATDLSLGTLIDDLAMVGLDHVTAFYASADASIHNTLFGNHDHAHAETLFHRTQDLEMADVAQVPLIASTALHLEETVEALLQLQVPNISFFALVTEEDRVVEAITAEGMRQVATIVEETADEFNVRYQWEPPVQRDFNIPLGEQVRQGPRCTGDVAIRIEPDGSVIPPRGAWVSAGNILHQEWDTIWQNEAFVRYRERVEAPTHCDICPGLAICAADCPRSPQGWSRKS